MKKEGGANPWEHTRLKTSEEDKNKVRQLLRDQKARKELLMRKAAPFTEEQLLKAENYMNGSDFSDTAHHQFGRLLLDAEMDESFGEMPVDVTSTPTIGRSAKKPSLDDYDRRP